MGSYKDWTNKENQSFGDDTIFYSENGNSGAVFEQYLSSKLQEDDMLSYWLIRDLYHHYLAAFRRAGAEIEIV